MNNEIKVSVLMPMYNARKLVKYSVDSLLNQTLKEIEVIVIDDKSTDDSYAYCRELYKDDDRVKVICAEQNGGPGKARMLGMTQAKGEYITFLDSDDGILPDALEKMYNEAKKFDADVLHTTGMLIPVSKPMPDDLMSLPAERLYNSTQDHNPPTETRVLTSDLGERMDMWLSNMIKGNVWGKLFRREFVVENDIVFPEMKMMEDIIFSLKAFITAKNYVQMPASFIIYRISNESTSRGERNLAFVEKLLKVVLQSNIEIPKCLYSVPYFKEHPAYVEKMMAVLELVSENMYMGPAYQKLGRKAIENAPEIKKVWREYFGEQADFVSGIWYKVMDALPPVKDLMDLYDSYEYWAEKLEKSKNKG